MFRNNASEGDLNRLFFLGLACLILAIQVFAQGSVETSRIRHIVDSAKREGKSQVSVPGDVVRHYAEAQSLEQVLRTQVPLLVQIDRKTSCLTKDESGIVTWYQVRVLEILNGTALPPFVSPDFEPAPPPELRSIPDDSILIHNTGGAVIIDGVKATMPEAPISLTVGEKYLLFVRFDETHTGEPTHLAHLSLGSAGAFSYSDQTDLFSAVSSNPDERLSSSLREKTNGSLTKLRTLLTK